MSVGRFLDSWVVERTLFEFVNTGGCACCGFSHGGMSSADFQAMCTDWETDDAKKEAKNPFPQAMQDEIWAERVKFRMALKKDFPRISKRFGDETKRAGFIAFLTSLDVKSRRKIFSMPAAELHSLFNDTYKFKSSYQVVMCAVIEQVSKYHCTGYTHDGSSDAEIFFEECLFAENGAFMVDDEYHSNSVDAEFAFKTISDLISQICGPSLLPKRDKSAQRIAEEAAVVAEKIAAATRHNAATAGSSSQAEMNDEDEDELDHGGELGPTFRSDRRLVRLVVFRYFMEKAWRMYSK